MAKRSKKESQSHQSKTRWGCLKLFLLMMLTPVIAYLGFHAYFAWQPAGKPAEFNQKVMGLGFRHVKFFPSIKEFDLDKIAGRKEVMEGGGKNPLVKERFKAALEEGYPVTFLEEEINIWLNQRVEVNQGGLLAAYIPARNVWVDFQKNEVELIIEREVPQENIHTISLFMKFESTKNGYSINRNSAQIGQLKVPGGFARLVIPAFNKLAEELEEELRLYKDDFGNLKIYEIKVEDGQITLDPRLPESRG